MMIKALSKALFVTVLWGAAAHAQSINVSFGHTSGGPSSSYAAAGAAGVWNTVTGLSGPTFTFVDINGATTNVTATQSPTATLITNPDLTLSGDDAALLNYGLDTSGAETCLFFSGFAAGTYEVLIYAWLPNQPTVKSRTRQDSAPSTIDVGGVWTGSHAEGVTYARYIVTVAAGQQLPTHSGLVPGAPNAALNGVQIRPLSNVPDAGTARPDAGLAPGPDAGNISSPDAGSEPGHDAGTISEPDAGSVQSDASTAGSSGGCSTGAGFIPTVTPALLVSLFIALRRRRGTAQV